MPFGCPLGATNIFALLGPALIVEEIEAVKEAVSPRKASAGQVAKSVPRRGRSFGFEVRAESEPQEEAH